eukprot:3156403-Amphidinium_carterae.1
MYLVDSGYIASSGSLVKNIIFFLQAADDKMGWEMAQRFLHHLKRETARDQLLRQRRDCTREVPLGEDDAPVYANFNQPEGFDQQALEDEQNNSGEGVHETAAEDVVPTQMDEQEPHNRGDVRPCAGDVIDEEPPLRSLRVRVDEGDEVGFHVPFRGTATSVPVREPRPSASWTGMTEGMQEEAESFFQ